MADEVSRRRAGHAAEKDELRQQRLLRLGIPVGEVSEQAVKGTGPGGQKVNKTQSGVLLRYEPWRGSFGHQVDARAPSSLNRFLALRELCDEVEVRVSPQTSARLAEIERARKQKDRTAAAVSRGPSRLMPSPAKAAAKATTSKTARTTTTTRRPAPYFA